MYHMTIRDILGEKENSINNIMSPPQVGRLSRTSLRHQQGEEASSSSISSVSLSLSVDKPRVKSTSPYRRTPEKVESSDVIERIRARNEARKF